MVRLLTLVSMLLALSVLPALAEAECYQNEHYLVIGQQRVDELGTDFIIREPAKGKINCLYEIADNDRVLSKTDDWVYYVGLARQFLVLNRSSGPDGNIVIYDLDGDLAAPVIDVGADDEIGVAGDQVTYWERTEPGNVQNCPEFAQYSSFDLGAVIAEEMIFDAATGQANPTGQKHCSQTQ
jgi:hypothetical protein